MKCAVVLADGVKQVMFAPENNNEKMALKTITEDDNITIEMKEGSFYENYRSDGRIMGYDVQMCKGGYLRAFEEDGCLMLVLRKKEPNVNPLP